VTPLPDVPLLSADTPLASPVVPVTPLPDAPLLSADTSPVVPVTPLPDAPLLSADTSPVVLDDGGEVFKCRLPKIAVTCAWLGVHHQDTTAGEKKRKQSTEGEGEILK
jgi:hypothetical protein